MKIFAKIIQAFAKESYYVTKWLTKRRYPGLDIHHSVFVENPHSIVFGVNNSISEQSKLRSLDGGKILLGDNVWLGKSLLIESFQGCTLKIGHNSSIQAHGFIGGQVRIGNAVVVAPNFFASSTAHVFNHIPYLPIKEQDDIFHSQQSWEKRHSPINIEDDCWIGINVAVMRGVTIGRGSIIGANAVVTKDIPPYSIAVGNPARAIKQRLDFSPPTVINSENLEHLPYFYSGFRFLRDDREKYINQGLVAQSEFSIALKAFNEQKNIVLTCSLLDKGRNYILRHDGVSIPLTEKETTIEFTAKPTETQFGFSLYHFRVVDDSSESVLEKNSFESLIAVKCVCIK